MEDFTETRQSDRVLHVTFYTDAVKHGIKSDEAGRPVFEDVDMVRIIAPGDKNNIIDTKVDDSHKFRFPQAYKHFKAGQTQGVSGWVLKEWPAITASQVKELNYHEIHTVEQLASVSDGTINKLGMGMHDLRTKAKAALAAAAGNANVEAQAKREADLQAELNSMKAQLAALSAAAESENTLVKRSHHKA